MAIDNTAVLLLSLVSEAGGITGKTRFQKLAYFLQEAEQVPLGLNFRMHHYGPYAHELEMRLQWLRVSDLVDVDDARIDGPVVIDISERGREAAKGQAYQEELQRVLENLGRKSPRQLELLGTVHCLAQTTGYDGSEQGRSRLNDAVKVWKEQRFSRQQIDDAIDELIDLGYLS